MTKNGFKDTRLLEALDYIDQDLIGEVAVKLKFEENAVITEEPVMTWRTPFKHWKRMLATVACLLLLSCAIPIASYILPRIGISIGGNAGAGTEELEVPTLEETQTLETEAENTEAEVIDFDKALERYADMSAEEIYAEVLKGGWVVIQDTNCENIVAIELWTEFLNAVEQGKESSILIAYYSNRVTIKITDKDDEQYAGLSQIVLTEVKYDGNIFVKSTKWFHPDYKGFYSNEYSYLLTESHKHKAATTYYLANKPDQRLNDIRYSSERVSMESAIILGDGLITVWDN